MPSVDPETLAKIGPFLDLAGRMGRFLGQLVEGRMEELLVRYSGEVATADPRPLTATLLEGLLRPILMDEVNLVNAPLMARERGLKVTESATAETGDFTSLVTATLRTGAGETTVAGTLVGRRSPRIVGIDGYEFELAPAGHLLVFANEDTPGVIGRIGTLLGGNRINIGGMQLGRAAGSRDALAVLSVDSAIPETVMGEIRALPFIRRARQLEI